MNKFAGDTGHPAGIPVENSMTRLLTKRMIHVDLRLEGTASAKVDCTTNQHCIRRTVRPLLEARVSATGIPDPRPQRSTSHICCGAFKVCGDAVTQIQGQCDRFPPTIVYVWTRK